MYQENQAEYLLGGKTPIHSILNISIGPLLSQLAFSLYSILNSIQISKTVGETGFTVLG
jgi:hypothetical protein